MRKITIIIAAILFFGCSAQKRCDKAYAKATKLGCVSSDTFYAHDTIKGFELDTFVVYSQKNEVDTLLVDSGGIRVLTIIKWKSRTVFQDVLKKDTVLETIIINDCPKLIPQKLKFSQRFLIESGKYSWLIIIFLTTVLILFKSSFKK